MANARMCWAVFGSAKSFCWAKVGKAKLIASTARVIKRIFIDASKGLGWFVAYLPAAGFLRVAGNSLWSPGAQGTPLVKGPER